MRFSVPLLSLLAERVAEARADKVKAVLTGKLSEADYRSKTGFIAGLEAALEIAHELDREVDGGAPLERR